MASDDSSPKPLPIAVLLSGGGTTMLNLAKQIEAGTLNAQIKLVVASNDTSAAKGIERAEGLGLPCPVIRRKGHDDTAAFSQAIFDRVREAGCELVCLAGFLSLLSIPEDFEGRVMNIHPSLLPAFGGKGMHGRHVHEAVLNAGAKVSGCTVHIADNTYDTGPILVQKTCPVLPGDDADALAARVFEQECLAYPEAVAAFAEGRVKFHDGIAVVE
ncbi:phosphoribosylglycinamide formyltransferase [Algisphaera agarilytica]|uniref:Phosphoribosylglycinamide formyltransferase n=1 Tax=Algisphaera agarilytica TaxID=1385975 RepID=A0A7X0HB32_9BACT|nr:phosphoribosylglycinamide formyltransferase [Algisphaera agarilytica]MBB6431451.1 phosphoribosylglycinamide formyltransferase-1 [Algisphaera agarilytica]